MSMSSTRSRRNFFIRAVAAFAGDFAVGFSMAVACTWIIQGAALGVFLSFVLWLVALIAALALSQYVVHPLAGQGLNLGLADVKALAETLAARESFRALGDAKLLRRYARQRQGAVRMMGGLTDGLLELFAHPNPAVRELRNRGLSLVNHLTPLKRLLAARALGS
jgi:hypothetical protein